MAAPTTQELEALELFKEEIKDIRETLGEYQGHDLSLLRWLRARDLDVERASRMLRRSLEWRKTDKIDEILNWEPPNVVVEEFRMKLSGYDDDGCPIGVIPFGKWDIRKIVEMKNKENFIRYIDQLFEFAMKLVERRSTNEKMITQFVMIMDLDKFSFRQISSRETIDAIYESIKRFEANHPETLKAAYLINAPRIFAYLFSFIKPLLTTRTLAKVQIFGTSGWKPVIFKNISADQVPSEIGGSNTSCSDHDVTKGFGRFDNPPIYGDFPENEMTSITVESGKKLTLDAKVELTGSRLTWGFKTDKHDVGFALVNGDGDELFHVPRTDSNVYVQKGGLICSHPGKYQLVFDNTFSRFRSKQLKYTISIQPPASKLITENQ